MKYWQKLPPDIALMGRYTSPMGGSRNPAFVRKNRLLFEIIQEGAVYGFEQDPVLYGEGSVFCHHAGQMSVSDSPANSYYCCLVVWFELPPKADMKYWPRQFQWSNLKSLHRFADEML